MYDCGFTKENNWFRYRAAAIIVENDCVLFACNEIDDYLYSIGGFVLNDEKVVVNNNEIGAATQKIYDELTGVQWGLKEDKFGWTQFVCNG